ncbi:MAG: hypothetical protein K2Q01_02160 [Rickettsiales bacterium]|nr:hypothetical protein [Rickettsiales bacterium]
MLPLFAPLPAQAADSSGQYQTLYYISCADYAAHRKEPVNTGLNAVDKIYVSGWLSGYNYLTPNTFNILSQQNVDGVMEWLDAYCKKYPTRSVEAALLQLTDDLYPTRVQEHPAAKAEPKNKAK